MRRIALADIDALSAQFSPILIDVFTGRYDKPSLADKAIAFNLSHSANWVAMAIAADDVGVDCDRIDITVDYQGLLPIAAHPQQRIDGGQAFYRTWTRKETVMKQLGLGFQLAPARVRAPDANAPLHAWQGTHIDAAGASERAPSLVDEQAPPGYCAALASDTQCDVRVFTLFAGHTNQEGCT
jgi:phosphopantetheinyl transferase